MAHTKKESSSGNGVAFLIGAGLLVILTLLWILL